MPNTSFDYKSFLKTLTNQAGVYQMFDKQSEVIYVGKAKDLKKRVSSYFRDTVTNAKTLALVANIFKIEVTVTHTETEALILENNLIKSLLPKYNVLLRDDKSYPYIMVTDHKHPRLTIHRGARKAKGHYYGPYPSAGAVRESLRVMQKLFPVRQCEDAYYRARSRPCLQYQLKRCSAPCIEGLVSDDEYSQQVDLVKLFLSGKNNQVNQTLVNKMEQASQSLEFESAAKYRDQIAALNKVQEQQWVSGDHQELDILGFAMQHGIACVFALFIRDGKVLGSKAYFPKIPANADRTEVLTSFVAQFYISTASARQPGSEVILSEAIDEQAGLEQAISDSHDRKIKLSVPSRGEKARYKALADTNAKTAVETKLNQSLSMANRFELLDEVIELGRPIQRIECFDISHTMGQQTTASCVVFNREGPYKQDYRRYNIEGITPGDDYAAMAQALERRFKNAKEDEKIPDVLLIDGGKGQLSQAEAFFNDWQYKMPFLIGVAKGTSRKPGLETLILPGSHETIELDANSPALHLIQHVRDESHRFAITGHRARRHKVKTTSSLEDIPGVGAKRRQALLKHMGGLQGLKQASVEEIARIPGISNKVAQIVFDHLHDKAD
ncbi:excinuclease ABC subunit UvrC [Catenovulum sp. SM1970]|uniref:excinuclease ABC subunit UvrC n=1 Tax=Marinifaba aquimaris TaxID=2741323 RepID=UPI0015734657|nr:excinuclease ABC subunit UvrC [Marinifaba aquimaris]NTS75238.1 excinuclease ABC subunit UvrC [Marinifaba aquimaris]